MTEVEMTEVEMSEDEIGTGLRELGPADFELLLGRLAAVEVPRVFAVYEVAPDRSDMRAFGWGLEFQTRAFFVGCTRDRPTYASVTSAERVRTIFGRHRDLRVVWPIADPAREFEPPWPADEAHEQPAAAR